MNPRGGLEVSEELDPWTLGGGGVQVWLRAERSLLHPQLHPSFVICFKKKGKKGLD